MLLLSELCNYSLLRKEIRCAAASLQEIVHGENGTRNGVPNIDRLDVLRDDVFVKVAEFASLGKSWRSDVQCLDKVVNGDTHL